MILIEMAMIMVKKPKLEKNKEKILCHIRVYSAMALSQESILGKTFCFVYKR